MYVQIVVIIYLKDIVSPSIVAARQSFSHTPIATRCIIWILFSGMSALRFLIQVEKDFEYTFVAKSIGALSLSAFYLTICSPPFPFDELHHAKNNVWLGPGLFC